MDDFKLFCIKPFSRFSIFVGACILIAFNQNLIHRIECTLKFRSGLTCGLKNSNAILDFVSGLRRH